MKSAMQELIEYIEEMYSKDGILEVIINKSKKLLDKEKEQMIDLVQSLKDYTHESGVILGHDEREASEFVEIFYNQNK